MTNKTVDELLEELIKEKSLGVVCYNDDLRAFIPKLREAVILEAKKDFLSVMEPYRTFHDIKKDNGDAFRAWFYYESDIESCITEYAKQKGEKP